MGTAGNELIFQYEKDHELQNLWRFFANISAGLSSYINSSTLSWELY